MKKNWVIILIIFLLALNAAFLGTLTVQRSRINNQLPVEIYNNDRPYHKNQQGFRGNMNFEEQLARDLQLDKKQISQLKDLSAEFHNTKKELNNKMGIIRRDYFHAMQTQNKDDKYLINLTDSLGDILAKKMLLEYWHYVNIKSICTPEQAQKMDSLAKTHPHFYKRKGHGRRHGSPMN